MERDEQILQFPKFEQDLIIIVKQDLKDVEETVIEKYYRDMTAADLICWALGE